jgi:putative glutamine amidotransferase
MTRPLIGITTHRRNSDDGQRDVFGLTYYYVEAVRNNGGLPVLIPLGLNDGELRELFERFDGLLFSGGGDIDPALFGGAMNETIYGLDEDRDRVEFTLLRWAAKEEKPFLGICRGIQVMNVTLGGTLFTDIALEVEGSAKHNYFPGYPRNKIVHPVAVSEEARLARILGSPIVKTNSLHHQAIKTPAPGVEVVALAPDGVIEGIELPGHRFGLGVQWHPECLPDQPEMQNLFAALVEAAG